MAVGDDEVPTWRREVARRPALDPSGRRRFARVWLPRLGVAFGCLGTWVFAELWAQSDDDLLCEMGGEVVGCQDPWYYGSLWRGVFGCATLVLALLTLACVWTIAKRSGGVTAGRGDESS